MPLKKVLDAYQKMTAPVKASIWFTICNILQKGIALITTPIFTRMLTTEQYGVYSVYQSWYSVIFIFASLNLAAGVFNNGMVKFTEDKYRYQSSMQGLSTVVTGGLFIVYLLFHGFWNRIFDLPGILLIFMFIQFFFEPAYQYFLAEQRYEYKYKSIVAVTLLLSIASPVVGVIAVYFSDAKAEARIISFVIVQVIIGIIFYIRGFIKGKTFFHKQYWIFALRFNLPLIPHYLSMTILNQSDRIMISNLVGKPEAAIYSIAYTVAMMMSIITNAINGSFIPYTYKSLKNKEYYGIKSNTNILLILVGIISMIAMACGPELIMLVATPDYYDAKWVIPPVAASVYFMFLYPLFGNIEFYYEKTKYVAIASCVGAIGNIILNYIFIQIFGYIAAGYTTLVCYILFSLMHYVFYRRVLKEFNVEAKEIYNIKVIIALSVIVLAFMFGMTALYEFVYIRYGFILLVLLVCFIKRNVFLSKFREIRKK